MSDMVCWLIGVLAGVSIYLILSQQMIRWLFGIVILSSTVNLIIFAAGRLYAQRPAFIPQENLLVNEPLANPLSQALILTAIVIGFGLLAFSLVLVRNLWRVFHTTDTDLMQYSEISHIKKSEIEV